MQIGVVYPQTELGGDPDAVHDIGLAAEEFGYDYVLAYDHVVGADHNKAKMLCFTGMLLLAPFTHGLDNGLALKPPSKLSTAFS